MGQKPLTLILLPGTVLLMMCLSPTSPPKAANAQRMGMLEGRYELATHLPFHATTHFITHDCEK